jgi:integrase
MDDTPNQTDGRRDERGSARRQHGRGSLRLRGKLWEIRYWHRGKQVHESTHTTDRGVALRMLKDRLKKAATPALVTRQEERVQFKALLPLYLDSYVTNRRRSIRDAKRYARELGDAFGELPVRVLAEEPERIIAYRDELLARGLAPASVNQRLRALRRCFRLAVAQRRIRREWLPTINLLDESDNVRQGFLEPADFEALCAQLPDDVADVARWGYYSLWRRANVLGLKWAQLALEVKDGQVLAGSVRVPGTETKNRRPLQLPLSGRLLDVIQRRWTARDPACTFVFSRQTTRGPKPIRDFRAAWDAACEATGLGHVLLHDLRRSGARNLRRAGVPEHIIMRLGGWRTASVFRRYDIVSDEDLAAAGEAYNAFLDAQATGPRKVVPLTPARRSE